jgi:hypothetical protein
MPSTPSSKYNISSPSANSCFNNKQSKTFASDYIQNKKAKLLYNDNLNKKNKRCSTNNYAFCGLTSQYDLITLKRAQQIKLVERCPSLYAIDKNDLVSGLYSRQDLSGVNIINTFTDLSLNKICPEYSGSTIDPTVINTSPFYYAYTIDKCGSLFGVTPCGLFNYNQYKKIVKPYTSSSQSLVFCYGNPNSSLNSTSS